MKIWIVIAEDLFDRSLASDTVSKVLLVTADKEEADTFARNYANKHGLILDKDSGTWWDDDEGATFVKVVESAVFIKATRPAAQHTEPCWQCGHCYKVNPAEKADLSSCPECQAVTFYEDDFWDQYK